MSIPSTIIACCPPTDPALLAVPAPTQHATRNTQHATPHPHHPHPPPPPPTPPLHPPRPAGPPPPASGPPPDGVRPRYSNAALRPHNHKATPCRGDNCCGGTATILAPPTDAISGDLYTAADLTVGQSADPGLAAALAASL